MTLHQKVKCLIDDLTNQIEPLNVEFELSDGNMGEDIGYADICIVCEDSNAINLKLALEKYGISLKWFPKHQAHKLSLNLYRISTSAYYNHNIAIITNRLIRKHIGDEIKLSFVILTYNGSLEPISK